MKKVSKKQQNTMILATVTEGAGNLPANFEMTKENIPLISKAIEEKLKALKGEKEKLNKVTEELPGTGRICDITDTSVLRLAYAKVTEMYEKVTSTDDVFQKASPVVKLGKFKIGNADLTDWQETIVSRYKEITHEKEVKQLQEMAAICEKHLSEDQKFENDMKKFKDLLS